MAIWLALTSLIAAQPGASPPADQSENIVVTGARPSPQPHGRAEAPYSETERVLLGSRIPRRASERLFQTIASESGVAGMVPGSGMDGTGGSSHLTATRRTTNCVAEDREVRGEIACILFRAQRATEVGAFDDARAALAPLLRRASMNGAERFHAGRLAFTLAQAEEDEALQAQALRLLLASGRLPEADHMRAERRLSALTAAGR